MKHQQILVCCLALLGSFVLAACGGSGGTSTPQASRTNDGARPAASTDTAVVPTPAPTAVVPSQAPVTPTPTLAPAAPAQLPASPTPTQLDTRPAPTSLAAEPTPTPTAAVFAPTQVPSTPTQAPATTAQLRPMAVQRAFPKLSFSRLTNLAQPDEGKDRLFVTEQGGRVLVFPDKPDAAATTTVSPGCGLPMLSRPV